jgi:hypothetical protein
MSAWQRDPVQVSTFFCSKATTRIALFCFIYAWYMDKTYRDKTYWQLNVSAQIRRRTRVWSWIFGTVCEWSLQLDVSSFNPDCTGQDHSWPRRFLRQIVCKLITCFNKNTCSCRTSCEYFLKLKTQHQKMMFWCTLNRHNIKSPTVAPTRTPLLSFTAVSDHLKAGEVPMSCGLQYGSVSVRIPICFRSKAIQSAQRGESSVCPRSRSF